MGKPAILYFPIRGRAEPIRLALAAAGVEWSEEGAKDNLKNDPEQFPFAQAPGYKDDDVKLSQSNAVLRYLGRKYNMYGADAKEAATMDMVLDGVEDIRRKYLNLVYQDKLEEAAKETYFSTHVDPATAGERNGGAHFLYLSNLLKRNGTGGGYVVGSALSIADIQLFEILDLHVRIFQDRIKTTYPELGAFYDRIASLPAIQAYRNSDLCLPGINGNGMG